MTEFTKGTATGTVALPLQLQQAGTPYQVTATVPNGGTARWSVSFPAGAFYGQFGVFPIEVQAGGTGTAYTATERTFLPFWPGDSAAAQVKGLQVAWVWPLIDTPQQGACSQTLRTSELAGSVASGGRLSTLLDAGAAWAKTDQLTWDIDPALLSDVSVMTRPYFTHGNDVCSERVGREAEHGGQHSGCRSCRRPPPASRPFFPLTPTWTWPRSAIPVSTATSRRPTGSVKRWPARYCRARSGKRAPAPVTERCLRQHGRPTASPMPGC